MTKPRDKLPTNVQAIDRKMRELQIELRKLAEQKFMLSDVYKKWGGLALPRVADWGFGLRVAAEYGSKWCLTRSIREFGKRGYPITGEMLEQLAAFIESRHVKIIATPKPRGRRRTAHPREEALAHFASEVRRAVKEGFNKEEVMREIVAEHGRDYNFNFDTLDSQLRGKRGAARRHKKRIAAQNSR